MSRYTWPTGGWLITAAVTAAVLLFAAGLAAYHQAWPAAVLVAVLGAVAFWWLAARRPHYHLPVRRYRCPLCGWRGDSRLHYCREHPS